MARKQGKFDTIDVPVVHSGVEITLPDSPVKMDLETAAKIIRRKIEESNEPRQVHETLPVMPLDGAVQFSKAMRNVFGWPRAVPTPGFFGDQPPTYITVKTGPNEETKCCWGRFTLPNIDGYLECSQTTVRGRRVFHISGVVRNRDYPLVERVIAETKRLCNDESIYQGKAFTLEVDHKGEIDFENPPEFLDVARVVPEELVFPQDVEIMVQANVWNRIEHAKACKKHGLPPTRGILLAGKYGVGKTMCASVTAKKCTDNGWTFINVTSVTALKTVLDYAKHYAPVVVFAEDVDRVVSGDRTATMDQLLNLVDGVQTKMSEDVMLVLTTNAVEKINPALLRPGRLDAVITVTPPDSDAVQRLCRIYSGGCLPVKTNLQGVGNQLAGQIPAVIRECCERAKLLGISRSILDGKNPEEMKINSDDLLVAAVGMTRQIELIENERYLGETKEQVLYKSLQDLFLSSANPDLQKGFDLPMKLEEICIDLDKLKERLDID